MVDIRVDGTTQFDDLPGPRPLEPIDFDAVKGFPSSLGATKRDNGRDIDTTA
jgi:hypothetical protein